jgi:hypothetical protein
MAVNFLLGPPHASLKMCELMGWRDLKVVDEKATVITYAITEIGLALLTVAGAVECLVRALFSLAIHPFSNRNERDRIYDNLRQVVECTLYSAKSLYYNIFSKFIILELADLSHKNRSLFNNNTVAARLFIKEFSDPWKSLAEKPKAKL